MSATYGAIDSAYHAIRGNHLYLNLPGAWENEYEFFSGYKGAPPLTWARFIL